MTTPHPTRRGLLAAFLVQAAVLAGAGSAHAALITWGAPTNITPGLAGDLNVSTAGTLVGAFNLGASGVSPATVTTVPFQSFAVTTGSSSPVTVGNFTLAPGAGGRFFSANTAGGSASPPFTTLSSGYQTLLAAYILEQGVTTSAMTLTMSGLSVGGQYQFEWWTNLSSQLPILTTATADGGGAVTLSSDPSFDGALGQYALGTFTANALTQAITFTGPGGDSPFVNAFQLRQLAPPPAVPEPGTALAGVILAGLVSVQRRRAR